MPDAEALGALIAGDDSWRDFQSRTSEKIDLTFSDLRGVNLAGRILRNCDFTGAQLENANLGRGPNKSVVG